MEYEVGWQREPWSHGANGGAAEWNRTARIGETGRSGTALPEAVELRHELK